MLATIITDQNLLRTMIEIAAQASGPNPMFSMRFGRTRLFLKPERFTMLMVHVSPLFVHFFKRTNGIRE